jgi:hypothetical protein
MGAFILAAIVLLASFGLAVGSELLRGMHPAPSMVPSRFGEILITGALVSIVIAATHWIPRIGW